MICVFPFLRSVVDNSFASSRLRSILTSSSNCTALCWHGLRPGISTKTEVENFLKVKSAELGLLSREPDVYPDNEVIYPFDVQQSIKGSLVVKKNILSVIIFNTNFANIGMLFEQIGPPDTYSASYEKDIEAYISFNIFYEKKGLVIGLLHNGLSKKGCRVELSNEASFNVIYLVKPNSGDLMYETVFPFFQKPKTIQKWQGIEAISLAPCN